MVGMAMIAAQPEARERSESGRIRQVLSWQRRREDIKKHFRVYAPTA